MSRYAATTPKLLRWFDLHNEEKPYRKQVRPFSFLLAYQTGTLHFSESIFPDPYPPTTLISIKRQKAASTARLAS